MGKVLFSLQQWKLKGFCFGGELYREHDVSHNPDPAHYLNHTMLYEYDPRDRITKVTKKDTATGNVLETETYKHDANGNVIEQTLDGITTTYTYDRNRLLYESGDVIDSTND